MYWDNRTESRLVFCKHETPIARKEHKCCECGKTIKIGEKYSYFGLLSEYYYYDDQFSACKTCLECEKDWSEILEVFYKSGEREACRVFGLLEEAVQGAFDKGFLTEDDRLVQEWLGIAPEVNVENLSPGERETHEREGALAQMKVYSALLL